MKYNKMGDIFFSTEFSHKFLEVKKWNTMVLGFTDLSEIEMKSAALPHAPMRGTRNSDI